MFLVGLTGGIATGKSTVSKILSEECGCLILDADLIAREGRQFVILDLPLLFETGKLVPYASYIVVVSCSEEQQIERLMKRNTLSEKEADQRISSQMSLAEKRRQATYIIDNNADIEYTRQQVKNLHQKLKESYFHWKIRILISLGFFSVFGLFNYILKLF
ncbi:unnamed protein product [Mytilus coruscus]|uniref:Dephospho-CoA kinase n=1 Tax=Mytilus coruscus TaxID=42192 RepID=A0A6J8BC49_MYTCO|nr:unnamed protein product [Mytilus coruscus]